MEIHKKQRKTSTGLLSVARFPPSTAGAVLRSRGSSSQRGRPLTRAVFPQWNQCARGIGRKRENTLTLFMDILAPLNRIAYATYLVRSLSDIHASQETPTSDLETFIRKDASEIGTENI